MSLLRVGYRSLSSGKTSPSAVAAALKTEQSHGDRRLEVKKAVCGMNYITNDVQLPIVDLMVIVDGAGPISENYGNAGVSHALRHACGLSTKNFTPFGTIRSLQQLGTGLTCTQTRESFIYSMRIHRDYFRDGFDFLRENVVSPSFKKWEVVDSTVPAMKMDISVMNPLIRAQEELFRVSYRRGLGNSLFAPRRNVGSITSDMLQEFHNEHFTMENMVFGASGLDQMSSRKLADVFNLSSHKATPKLPFKFIVGESRLETRDRNAYIYLASESPLSISGGSQEAVLADYLLSLILGKEIPIKRGSGVGKLTQALRGALGDTPFGVASLYKEFKNNTLLGASLITEAASAGKAIDVILSTLKGLKVTDMELKAAKKRALNDIYTISESSTDNLLEGLSLYTKTGEANITDWVDVLDRVSLSDVQASAGRLAQAKFSISSVGNLAHVPYLDSIQK
eukprot:TRINITY_DN457_c0_g1_i1.p1 TRINITY_DN457_c0_g1~~TRINITY_DN457_c0_g1_i1.p1  ORF type:complete len:477 (+),score=139.00 TRINITY_DN457_c0_g1_i1:73-1431(+)